MLSASIQTQFGLLLVSEDEGAICALRWADAPATDTSPLLTETLAQLAAYDAGTLETFDVPLRVKGSDFQRAVCDLMFAIPFGETVTYGDIAKALTVPAQAVGQAWPDGSCDRSGRIRIHHINLCHRVMGAKGLTGFSGAGGVETKVALLRHEKAGGFLI